MPVDGRVIIAHERGDFFNIVGIDGGSEVFDGSDGDAIATDYRITSTPIPHF